MNRGAATFVGGALLAALVATLWLPWNNPCLEIDWVAKYGPTDYQGCDNWPTPTERHFKLAVLLIALAVIGAVLGRYLGRFAILFAGLSTSAGALAAYALWDVVPTVSTAPVEDSSFFTTALLMPLLVVFAAGSIGAGISRMAMPNKSLERTRER